MTAPRGSEPIERVLAPLRDFTHSNVSGGLVLMATALVALIWANSPWAADYDALFHTRLSVGFGGFEQSETLHFWINEALMAVFFLLVGLEIKREVLVGELSGWRQALLPAAAAIGGALVPALIFVAVVGLDGPEAAGWGIPMATDIAFALGVLALVGRRAPLGLRIFVTALAIVDDLLAVVVIAVFYSAEIAVVPLAAAAGLLIVLAAVNGLGVRRPIVYALLGIALWFAMLESGVHATIAGVLLALTVPARKKIAADDFADRARQQVDEVQHVGDDGSPEHQHAALWELETLSRQAQAPMLRMEHALSPWVAFAIVPLFALANAGVALRADFASLVGEPIVLGVALGLIIGKQLGITAAAWLVVRLGLAALPDGVGWRHIYGAAWICAIGFTMSLFIADLAYGQSPALELAKLGILAASIIAGVVGFVILRRVKDVAA